MSRHHGLSLIEILKVQDGQQGDVNQGASYGMAGMETTIWCLYALLLFTFHVFVQNPKRQANYLIQYFPINTQSSKINLPVKKSYPSKNEQPK
jgi:hypothetical protein